MAHIMVIDDEDHIRHLYKEELTDNGHEVSLAGNAKEALDQIRTSTFDLAILDIKLGDTNGLDLLQHIRKQAPELPVILCTAYDSFQEHSRAAAATDYVVKSFDLTKLKKTISKILSKTAD
jgi:two-component system response regulator (stage 0 sporulation protein F)